MNTEKRRKRYMENEAEDEEPAPAPAAAQPAGALVIYREKRKYKKRPKGQDADANLEANVDMAELREKQRLAAAEATRDAEVIVRAQVYGNIVLHGCCELDTINGPRPLIETLVECETRTERANTILYNFLSSLITEFNQSADAYPKVAVNVVTAATKDIIAFHPLRDTKTCAITGVLVAPGDGFCIEAYNKTKTETCMRRNIFIASMRVVRMFAAVRTLVFWNSYVEKEIKALVDEYNERSPRAAERLAQEQLEARYAELKAHIDAQGFIESSKNAYAAAYASLQKHCNNKQYI